MTNLWPEEVRLTGEGLVLREWAEDDIAFMPGLFDNPAVARFTPLPSPFDEVAAKAHYEKYVTRRAEGTGLRLAITDDGGEPLGEVVLFLNEDAAELGYAVGPAHRGRDLAARSLRVLTTHALDLGLGPLRLKIDAENAASQAVARRVGYALTDLPPEAKVEKGLEITLLTWEYAG
ncbi:GNAT family N-acetyltransferase [Amycolatopsis sp. EV170708-02-1]|uniref:GNAT family N-acetyltransferase n=1 Tax=Amycolatopsis sp. EV170708-02-1 TaxID=2919322 RepID=UPI001F0C74D7|nr:GNAT family N-acetyltransferase [Amycolatopsis sp. EV170708-02-1]UMP03811.1 GNAT family N-acetyltransferase [Amycolatopsis sp. EV170708-02-1]